MTVGVGSFGITSVAFLGLFALLCIGWISRHWAIVALIMAILFWALASFLLVHDGNNHQTAYGLFFYTEALLFPRIDETIQRAHPIIVILIMPLILAVAGIAYFIRGLGWSWDPTLQLTVLVGTAMVLLMVLSSTSLLHGGKRFIERNLFTFAYNYRREWLRLAGSMASTVKELARQVAKAEHFDLMSKYVTFVAHDLKNLISQLLLMLQQTKHHVHNPAFVSDSFSTIGDAVEKLTQLMHRVRAGARTVPPVAVNLGTLLEHITDKSADGHPIEPIGEQVA